MADTATTHTSDQTLESKLEEMLETEKFDPPEEFVKHALLDDPSVYDEAEKDWKGWWMKQAKELHWFKEPTEDVDESDPPFYKWFADGKINASYNCVDRHVEAGNGDRVAFHWRGEEGEEEDITYADLHRDVQKFANALKDLGIEKGDIVGIFLPMIPEVVVAMLACARIGAPHNVVFGGFSAGSVRERMEFSEAKALITVDGARRKGKTANIKQAVDEEMGDLDSLEHIVVVKRTDADCEMKDGRDVWYHEILDKADDECPAEELDAEHPLYVLYTSGSTAKPKGVLHTTGGYLTGVASTHRYVFDLHQDEDVYWCSADVGWVTGHSYIVYGPMLNGATSVMYEGAPDYPHKGIWWELCERYGVTKFYTAPTAIRACMKWGVEHVEKHDLSKLKLLGTVGEPINPKAWLWYYIVIGGERCPIVDTWWQTETGAIMITPLPGDRRDQAGFGHAAVPRHRRRCRRRARRQAGRRRTGTARSSAPVAVDAAHAVQGGRPVRRDVLREVREGDVPRRRRRAQGQGRLLLDHRADRRRRERVRAPDVDGRGRVRDRRPPEGGRGGGDRSGRRRQRPVDLRVRDARGRRHRRVG